MSDTVGSVLDTLGGVSNTQRRVGHTCQGVSDRVESVSDTAHVVLDTLGEVSDTGLIQCLTTKGFKSLRDSNPWIRIPDTELCHTRVATQQSPVKFD